MPGTGGRRIEGQAGRKSDWFRFDERPGQQGQTAASRRTVRQASGLGTPAPGILDARPAHVQIPCQSTGRRLQAIGYRHQHRPAVSISAILNPTASRLWPNLAGRSDATGVQEMCRGRRSPKPTESITSIQPIQSTQSIRSHAARKTRLAHRGRARQRFHLNFPAWSGRIHSLAHLISTRRARSSECTHFTLRPFTLIEASWTILATGSEWSAWSRHCLIRRR